LLVGIVVAGLNFRYGYFLLGNDNFSPEFKPWLSLKRFLLEPGYRSYSALGYASDSDSVEIYRSLIFAGLDLILPRWLISQGYFLIGLIVAPVSIYFIINNLIARHTPSIRLKEFTAVTGALVYLFSLQTVNIYYYTNALFEA